MKEQGGLRKDSWTEQMVGMLGNPSKNVHEGIY